MVIHLTGKCNQNCLFCKRVRSLTELPKNEVKKKIFEAKQSGSKTIFFSGGEPTLRKDLPEMISFIKAVGLRAEIITNGLMLSYKGYLNKLISSGLDEVCFSIHSHKKEVADKLSQRKGSFDLQIKALDNLKDANITVTINTVIVAYNYKHLKEFVGFLSERYPNIHSFDFLLAAPEGNARENKDVLVMLKELKKPLHELMTFCTSNNIRFTVEFVPFCFMQGFENHMLLSCDLETIKVANITDHCFRGDYFKVGTKIENSRRIKDEYIRPEKCKTCRHYLFCPGLKDSYAEIFGTDEVEPL